MDRWSMHSLWQMHANAVMFFSHQLQESFGSLARGAIVAKRYPMVRKVPKYKTVPVPPMTPQLQPTTHIDPLVFSKHTQVMSMSATWCWTSSTDGSYADRDLPSTTDIHVTSKEGLCNIWGLTLRVYTWHHISHHYTCHYICILPS